MHAAPPAVSPPCRRLGDGHPAASNRGCPGPERPIGDSGGRGGRASKIWRFDSNMAEASNAEAGGGCAEKGPDGPSPESVPPGTVISRMKLLDTTVDTFLQKLVAAGR